jgi:hypothetical protein
MALSEGLRWNLKPGPSTEAESSMSSIPFSTMKVANVLKGFGIDGALNIKDSITANELVIKRDDRALTLVKIDRGRLWNVSCFILMRYMSRKCISCLPRSSSGL